MAARTMTAALGGGALGGRIAPTLLRPPAGGVEGDLGSAASRLRFYVLMRAAVFVPAFLVTAGLSLVEPALPLRPIAALAGLFGLSSLVATGTTWWRDRPVECARAVVCADVVFITLGELLLGGPERPVTLFYLGPIVSSAWLLGSRGPFAVAGLSAALYGGLVAGDAGRLPGLAGTAAPAPVPWLDLSFHVIGFFAIAVTAWGFARLLAAVIEDQRVQLGGLLDRARQAHDDERRLVAADLHDSVLQWLTGTLLRVEVARELARRRDAAGIGTELTEIEVTVQRVIRELRTTVLRLQPPELESRGLVAVLGAQLDDWRERTGVDADLALEGQAAPLPPAVASGLYHICIEALNNIAKHAGARHVRVTLAFAPGGVALTVKDDGVGFSLGETLGARHALSARAAAPDASTHVGLYYMRQRAMLLGGKLRLASRAGLGTTVAVEVPVAA